MPRDIHRLRRIGAAALLALGIAACERPLAVCTSELTVRLGPSDTTVLSGATLSPDIHLTSCGGAQVLAVRAWLESEDTAVVRVLPATRQLLAVGLGSTRVTVRDSTYGSLGDLEITVVSPP